MRVLALLALVTVGGVVALTIAGLLVSRSIVRRHVGPGHQEIAGVLFQIVGTLYAVLLAFVVFVVWSRFVEADQAVTQEAAALVAVFRDTQTFPEPLRTRAQRALLQYAREGVPREWVRSGTRVILPHRSPDALNPAWRVFRQLEPQTPKEQVQFDAATARLRELERQRHLRHMASEATLNSVIWVVLLVGAVCTVGFTFVFHMANVRMQGLMTGLMAGLIGILLFLIWALNEPFIGAIQVSRGALDHALEQFRGMNTMGP